MHIAHIALGGCLQAPPIQLGLTADTGGHLTYLLGAALAQGRLRPAPRIDLYTRRFDAPELGSAYAMPTERISDAVVIRRLSGGGTAYAEKEMLEGALPELTAAFLAELARGPRPDVLHAHFADAAELALAARETYGIPVVYTPHSLALGKRECGLGGPGLERRIRRERRAIAEADAVIVSSRDEAERQLRDYGIEVAGRTHRISPGVYTPADERGTAAAEALLAPFLRDPDKPLVLAIARPVAKKNLSGLLEAYAKTPGLRERANLAIVAGLRDHLDDGGPEQRAVLRGLADAIDRHDLYGSVALPKRHRPADIPQFYRLAAERGGVFVNPAFHEPFGLTLLEAAERRLPVVATDCGGPYDILHDLGHGQLVDPGNRDALGAAILRAVTDADLRARQEARLARGLGDYSWDTYAARAVGVYRQLATVREAPVRPLRPRQRRLLVCDVDGTLTGCPDGARRFGEVLRNSRIPFVIATGRSLPEARRVLLKWGLPQPEIAITAVGTEIHVPDRRGRLQLDRGYARAIELAWEPGAIRAALTAVDVDWQREVEQRPWKLGLNGDAAEAQRVRAALRDACLDAEVTYSHGRLIDVTPPGVTKATAMAWVAERYGLTAGDCIACGDSGNDDAMLRAAGTAVVVANALDDLDGLRSAHVMRTRAPHAAGVVEALRSLGLATAPPAIVQKAAA